MNSAKEIQSPSSVASSTLQILIIAGEASGDMHGARLVKEMKSQRSDLAFCGVGGKYLREQGVDIMFSAEELAVVGIFEVFSHLKYIRWALKGLADYMRSKRPALLILIDFPDFNLILAKKAKALGIPVFYYISPQVWAWRSGRVKTIAERVNKLAVILPFEKDFYNDRGIDKVEFVGHPLVDTVRPSSTTQEFKEKHKIKQGGTVIGLLPGSRKKEITAILPDFLGAARLLAQENKNLSFLLPLAPTLKQEDLNLSPEDTEGLNLQITREDRYSVMTACDLVMAASGTVTLELAILKIPMVVAYRISPLTHFVGRRLIKVKFASLVNLVARRQVVDELLQGALNAEALSAALKKIWPGKKKNKLMHQELAEVSRLLGKPGASKNAARLALELI